MESGIRALTVELAPTLPGDYPPLEGLGVIDQHGELAVVEQAKRAEQLTADRDRFFFKVREPCGEGLLCGGASASLWRTCSGTVLHTAFPLKVREPEAQANGAWGRP